MHKFTLQHAARVPKNILTSLLVALWLLAGAVLQAQPTLIQAQTELQSRGIDEAELRARMLERGIDLDEVSPEQIPQVQPILEAVIAEMEAEKANPWVYTPRRDTISPIDSLPDAEQLSQIDSLMEDSTELLTEPLKEITIYGQQIFQDKSLELYRTTNRVKPPDSYVLGPGDEITVSIFGASQANLQYTINEEGYIQPPRMPRISLKGITYGQAKKLLRQRFSNYFVFRPDQFALSLTSARTVTVNIFGEVAQNGSYTISAINTAFNAIIAAGGITELGSIRNIQLIRNGEVQYLDVYEFLKNPSIGYDFFLQENDIIFVPVAERLVRIQGAIRRPFIYELTEDEQLNALIAYAGSFRADAYRKLLQVERIGADERRLIDVPYAEIAAQGKDFQLMAGDTVNIRNVPAIARNSVSINGAVELEGAYALAEGTRVQYLLKQAILQPSARLDLAFIFRENNDGTIRIIQINPGAILADSQHPDNQALQRNDRIEVFEQARFADEDTFSIGGAVREPTKQAFDPSQQLNIDQAIQLAGGLLPNAASIGYVLRTDTEDPNQQDYLWVDVKEAIQNPVSNDNLRLQARDSIFVFTQDQFTDAFQISVTGAVRQPGDFPYNPSISIKDALILAGGLQFQAATNRIDIYRVQIKENEPTETFQSTIQIDKDYNVIGGQAMDLQLKPFDRIVVRSVPEFELQRYVQITGEVRYPGPYAITENNQTLVDIIQRAGGLTEEAFLPGIRLDRKESGIGNVVFDAEKAMRSPSSRENLIVKEGDSITVPKRQDIVSIGSLGTRAGKVFTQELIDGSTIEIAWQGSKSARWYVNEYAGGFSDKANRNSLSVTYPNGRIKQTRRILFFRSYPTVPKGALIQVGLKDPKPEREKKERKEFDWRQGLLDVVTFTSSILSLILLIDRLQ